MNQVDTILNCRWVIPIEPHNVVYDNYAIIINEGRIVNLLPQDQAKIQYQSKDVYALFDHAVLPGFVNAHTHSPMVLFKGLADDLPLMEWLHNHIWPAEAKWLYPDFIEAGTQLAIAEMIKNGTTCFNEHFFFPEVIATTVLATKIRACVGATIINFPTNWSKDENEGFTKFQQLFNAVSPDPLLTFSLAPHAPYTTTDQILEKINYFAQEHSLTIHMHVHETAHEIAESLKYFNKRPLQRLYDLGLLSSRFQCVHMTQITADDITLLSESKAHVIHCPESNLKLASGYCPVAQLLEKHINIALGTDGAASNNNLDMIGEIRTAALIAKTVANSATAVNAATALRIATLNGAKALNLSHEIGSIIPGKAADLIAINLNHFNTQPVYHPISQIVYSATNTQISDVWVNGAVLMKNHQLQTLDEQYLVKLANKWRDRLQ